MYHKPHKFISRVLIIVLVCPSISSLVQAKKRNITVVELKPSIPHPEIDGKIYDWYRSIHPMSEADKNKSEVSPFLLFYGLSGLLKSCKAEEIGETSKAIGNAKVITIDCAAIVNEWQNSGAQELKRKIEEILEYIKNGIPVVLILEEAHEIATVDKNNPRKRDAQTAAYTVIDQFLDKIRKEKLPVCTIATTNYLNSLADEFVRRFDRFEFKSL